MKKDSMNFELVDRVEKVEQKRIDVVQMDDRVRIRVNGRVMVTFGNSGRCIIFKSALTKQNIQLVVHPDDYPNRRKRS